ncbi:hypothetical protein I6F35_06225 [Bradyrhizobium sp. BRP22]|uniref:hypothetical protein n=1 Tax=Bradyrhizobium sp. BRP22 TaxID=2793821 RepID=UPI001CD3E562|nr:hypothetical protein [Bradyrhizobium sp. BRP22]MCA1452816.1 hypothetical protein [Bradyrhizobium sp. BRP22]
MPIVVENGKLVEGRGDILNALRLDKCPDCLRGPLRPGPRGSTAINLFCDHCGSRWNVATPRYVIFAQRIK